MFYRTPTEGERPGIKTREKQGDNVCSGPEYNSNLQCGSVFGTIARDKWVMEQFVGFHKTVLDPGELDQKM